MADRTIAFPTKDDSPKTVEVNAGDDIKFTDSDGNSVSASVLIPDGVNLIAVLPTGETLILENFFGHTDDPAEIVAEDGSTVVFSAEYTYEPDDGPSFFIPDSNPNGLGYEPVDLDGGGIPGELIGLLQQILGALGLGAGAISGASGLNLDDRARYLFDILQEQIAPPDAPEDEVPIELVALNLVSAAPIAVNNPPVANDDPVAPDVFQTPSNQALMTTTLGSVAQDLEPNPGNPDGEDWNIVANPDILNSTATPHLTINGNGDGSFDYFAFTGTVGSLVTLDIDNENFGASIFLYDIAGNLIGSNLMGPGGDPGDGQPNAALLQVILPSSGTFIAGVGGPGAMDAGGQIGGTAPMGGETYELNLSVANHPILGPQDPAPEVELNHPDIPPGFPFAQNIDGENWTLANDANIIDSTTVRHTTITGSGNGTFDYYSFTAGAGERGIFDIDANNFDSSLFLFDASGNLIASNDDGPMGDPGNVAMGASLINGTFTFPSSGQFVIGVGTNLSSAGGGLIFDGPPAAGANYLLNVSVGNHAPGGFDDPIAEVEANHPNFDLSAFATDIDVAGWNQTANPDILNATTVPHVTIVGGGDGTFDYFSFTATAGSQGVFDIDNNLFDTQLFLYDANGNLLASNDDSMAGADSGDGSPGASRITFDFTGFPPTGTYFLGVAATGSADSDGVIAGNPPQAGNNYRLHASLSGHPLNGAGMDPFGEGEPNQPPFPGFGAFAQDLDPEDWNQQANPDITNATTIPHISVNGTGDGSFDYYSFSATGRIVADIDDNNFDSQIFLYDSTGNLVATNDDNPDPGNGVMGASLIDVAGLPFDTYTVAVARTGSMDGGGLVIGNAPQPGDAYTLHVSVASQTPALPPTGAETEPNHPAANLAAVAQDVDDEQWNQNANPNIANATTQPHLTVKGTGDGSFDYFSFTAAAGAMGVFDIDNNNFNTALFLYDAAGNLLARNDVSMAGPDTGDGAPGASRIAFTFGPAGTYIIGVGTGGGQSGDGGGFIAGTPQGPGALYDLNISLTGHPLNPPADPVAETETNHPGPGAILGSLLVNDFDPDGDSISVTGFTGLSANGAAVNVLTDGSFTYDPSGIVDPGNPIVQAGAGDTVTDTFTYTISDSGGLTDTATVTITVDGVNDPPVAGGDNVNPDPGDPRSTGVSITEDNGATNVGNLLANDLDPDTGDAINIVAVSAAGMGLTNQVGNTVTYDPNGQFENLDEGDEVTDTFTYTISDSFGLTDTATVTVTITGVNDAPVAQDDAGMVSEDGPALMGNLFADNGNGVDADVDDNDIVGTNVPITLVNGMNAAAVLAGTAITLPSGAQVTITNEITGTFTYDPNGAFESVGLGETDTDSFTYTIEDPLGAVDTATVTITINGFNDQPTSDNVVIAPNILENTLTDTPTEDSTVNVDVGAQANAADIDTNDILSFEVGAGGVTGVTSPVAGFVAGDVTVSVTDASNGLFDVSSAKFNDLRRGETAVVVFEYNVRDDSGATTTPTGTNETELGATRTATVTIEGTNDRPVVSNIDLRTSSPVSESTLAASMGNPNAVYTPPTLATDAGLTDEDDNDTHTFELVGTNGGLTAMGPLAGSGPGFVVPAADITVAITNAATGAYTVSSSKFNDLSDGETLDLTFSYAARDNSGATTTPTGGNETELSATRTVMLRINGSNDAPDANDDNLNMATGNTFTEDSGVGGNIAGQILGNDIDPDTNDTLGINQLVIPVGFRGQLVAVNGAPAMFTGPVGAPITYNPGSNLTSLTFNPFGQFEDLAHGVTTTTSFDYRATDGNGGNDTATVTITVTGVNDAPVLNLDANNSGGGADDGDFDSTFQVGGTAVNIADTDAALTDIDTGETIERITATITNRSDGVNEILAAVASGGADTINYDTGTGILTITASGGEAPVADFQNVLRSITYENTAGTPTQGVRNIDVQADDGGPVNDLSNTVTANVDVVSFGTVIVQKETDPDGGMNFDFTNNTGNTGGPGTFSLNDDGMQTLNDVPLGALNDGVVEDNGASGNFVLDSITIVEDGTMNSTADLANAAVDLNVEGGETITVTFNNVELLAVDDAYNVIGNVGITVNAANGLIQGAGADTLNGATSTITVNEVNGMSGNVGMAITTGMGGTLTVNADGSFTYDPATGFDGTDTFTYSLGNVAGTSADTATVTLTVADTIWFIDDSAAGGGDGSLSNPFNSIGAFNALNNGTGNNPEAGDNIFLFQGAYGDGINLLNNQVLIGQGFTSGTLDGVLGITVDPTTTPLMALPTVVGTNPVITGVTGTDSGIDLASGNTVRGLSVGNTATGEYGISGSNFGTLTIDDVAISGAGGILDLTTGTITDAGGGVGTFANLITTDTTVDGIILNGVGGSFTVSGNTTISTLSSAAQGIDIDSTAAGASFDFGSTTVNNGVDEGIDIQSSGSATFTFDTLDITNDSGDGLLANNGGTINIGGTTNTINTTGGSGVSLTNTAIGTGGFTFDAISVNGLGTSTSAGIVLDTTGSNSFTVTGDGSTATQGGNGSGGTIQDILNDGVRLFNTDGTVTLRNMTIEDIGDTGSAAPGHHGIDGQQVDGGLILNNVTIQRVTDSAIHGETAAGGSTTWNGLTITDSVLNNSNRFHVANQGDGGATDEAMVTIEGISGTISVLRNDFDLGPGFLNFFTASSGTLDATIQGNTFDEGRKDLANQASIGSSGVRFNLDGSIDADIRIGDPAEASSSLGNTFTNAGTDAAIFIGGTSASNSWNLDLVISQNTSTVTDHTSPSGLGPVFDFPNGGIGVESRGTGSLEAIISQNTLTETQNSGGLSTGSLRVDVSGANTEVIVRNNTLTRSWDGPLFIRADDTDGNGARGFILVQNNTYIPGLVGVPGSGDDLDAQGFANSPVPFISNRYQVRNGAVLDLTIDDDDMVQHDSSTNPSFGSHDILINGDSTGGAGVSSTFNVHIVDSTGPNVTSSGMGFRLRNDDSGIDATDSELNLSTGASGAAAATDINTAQAQTVITGNTNVGAAVVQFSGTNIVAGLPTLPTVTAPLLAADGEAVEGAAVSISALNQAQLDAVAQAAVDAWTQLDLTDGQLAELAQARIVVTDLEGARLGESFLNAVRIDIDAAGHGWFIDTTPWEHSEFAADPVTGNLQAMAGGPADGQIDLLTVVTHEIGHVLGLTDLYAEVNAGNLMFGSLEAGQRKLADDSFLDLKGFLAEIAHEADLGSPVKNTVTLTAFDVLELGSQSVDLDSIAAAPAPAQLTANASPANPADAQVAASAGTTEAASLEAANAAAASIADDADDDAAVQEMAAAV